MSRWGSVCVAMVCLALNACAPLPLDYESATHVVRRGETLYTIAWQHGVDHRELASWNSLRNPDLIFPGQRLRLRSSERVTAAASPRRSSTQVSNPLPASGRAPARPEPVRPAALPQPVWTWPTQGRIAAPFASAEGIGSGIAVTGANGQSVRAAADGRVVYVGTGLAGYGQLVIVKHNDAWLSAYGHTERVLVSQGDAVEQGDRIASMGLGPRREPRLHFEIRRDGVPVNPLPLLPSAR